MQGLRMLLNGSQIILDFIFYSVLNEADWKPNLQRKRGSHVRAHKLAAMISDYRESRLETATVALLAASPGALSCCQIAYACCMLALALEPCQGMLQQTSRTLRQWLVNKWASI